jgi:hypothetical protein
MNNKSSLISWFDAAGDGEGEALGDGAFCDSLADSLMRMRSRGRTGIRHWRGFRARGTPILEP